MKILVVDDEQDICEILQYNLENEGFEVVADYSAGEPLNTLFAYSARCYDGRNVWVPNGAQTKNDPTTARIPIIFITALDSEDNLVKGLNIGADDYIAKPLGMKEVKARVKAVLRRTQLQQTVSTAVDNKIAYEGIMVDLNAKTVVCDGKELEFTKLEFELLSFFLQHPNTVFSREDLLNYCWPQDVLVLDRTVDVNITRLRKKIGHYGKQIKTRVGYGYFFEK